MLLKFFNGKTDNGVRNEYLAVITGCFIYFSVGAHTGWTSPFIPKLQSDDYPFEVTNEAASYIAIAGPIGDIFGEIISTLIVDRIGRKATILMTGIPILTSNILIYFSYMSPILIYTARFLGGISMGSVMSISTMYIAEISRPAIRGKLGVFSAFSFIAGLITVNLLGNYLDMHQTALIFATVIVVFFVAYSGVPETPYYLIMKGKLEKAECSLHFLRRTKNVEKELLQLTKDVERQLSERGNYSDLLRINSNRKAIFIMVMGRIFQQFTGCTSFAMYAQNLLSDSKEIIEPHVAIIIIYILQASSVLVSGHLADKFGRVTPIIFSLGACFITLLMQAIYYHLRDFSNLTLPSWIAPILLGTYYVLFQIGIGSLLNILLGEIFSSSIKAKATCVVNVAYSISVILATKFFQISVDYLHISVCFYVFACCSFTGMIFMKIFLPETKGKTLEEIQMVLKGERRKST